MAATLTQTAFVTRRAVKFAAIALIIYLIIRIFWSFIRPLIVKPPPPDPPKEELGSLPRLQFPEQQDYSHLEFTLQLPEGEIFPNMSDRAKVYVLEVPQPKYSNLEDAISLARLLKFTSAPVSISPTTYRWHRETDLSGDLTVNIVHQSFDLVLDWRTDQELLEVTKDITEDKLVSEFIQRLSNARLYTDDLKKGHQEFIYYQYYNGQLIRTDSYSQADLTQINYFRKDIDDLPVIPANLEYPLVWGLATTAKDTDRRVAEIHYRHQSIAEKSGEYPLITPATAWQALLDGQGYISNWGIQSQITVRDVSLAYYEPQEPELFLHPIYVFSGDDDFSAYVPALQYEKVK